MTIQEIKSREEGGIDLLDFLSVFKNYAAKVLKRAYKHALFRQVKPFKSNKMPSFLNYPWTILATLVRLFLYENM